MVFDDRSLRLRLQPAEDAQHAAPFLAGAVLPRIAFSGEYFNHI
jgi:hypothetical protein